MTYERDSSTACCGCKRDWLKLNDFGLCASCFANLDDEKRKRLDLSAEIAELPHVIVNRPSPTLRAMLIGSLLIGAVAGAGSAYAVVHWGLR